MRGAGLRARPSSFSTTMTVMTEPIGTLGVLALDCPDAMALAVFYRQLIGGEVVEHDGGRWVELRSAKGTVAFQQIEDHRRPTWPGGDTPQQAHIDIDVDDLESREAQVIAIGAIKADVQPSPDDFRVFIDPAGHPFCLVLPWQESPPRADAPR